ncbi:MAG: thioredoxin domain-containing protein [Rhizobiales bacterium]|nr:thioredoxin domain-containing protein [Hyphomicrobiales bacterium]
MRRLSSRLPLALFMMLAGLLMLRPAAMAETATSSFSNAQKDELGDIIRDYLVKNPEVLLEAMHELDLREKARGADKFDKALAENYDAIYKDPNSYVGGNPRGDITIVEFFDYQCGYCKRSFEPLIKGIQDDGNIRLILKEFPILGPTSVTAARAAMAAARQGKYFDMHKALYEHKGSLTDAKVIEIASDIGLDVKKLATDMKSPEIGKIIKREYALAESLGVEGTPAFIINEKFYPGAMDAERLADIIKDIRGKR